MHVDPPPQDIVLLGIPSLSSPCAQSVLSELGAIKRPQTPVWGKQSLSQTPPPSPRHQGQKGGTEAGEVLRRSSEGFLQVRIFVMGFEG